ncbi:MAG TPA: DegT/DnrJ/EryC1/StrS family aminotransferase [Pyrinomonadaceae bacterium]|nr:DegT/DnrJ/EryC1/StrS family aminotransferase [Pyrinomonadaceae bacterium]
MEHLTPTRRSDFLLFGAPDIREPEIQEVVETLRSGWLSTGPRCRRFEELFCEYIGCKHAIALNSCTAGLELALEVLGIGPGDEVITTPLTFCATANVIVHRGAKPVFVDVDRETGNIDTHQVAGAITHRTKAILPVHLYGRPCEMDELMSIARQHGLFVVEDAAHASEAWYRGRKIGTIGDITVYSFYATKNLVTGEGGMLVTNNALVADEIRVKHLHGMSRDAWKRYSDEGFQPYDVVAAGYKYNMMDIQAALGIHQLARLEDNLKIRERHWQAYDEAFESIEGIITPQRVFAHSRFGKTRHARHLYTILLDIDQVKISRQEFMNSLRRENIGTGIHFTALHLHSFYQQEFGYKRGDFPNAEFISDRTISLPLSSGLSAQDVNDVINAVHTSIVQKESTSVLWRSMASQTYKAFSAIPAPMDRSRGKK